MISRFTGTVEALAPVDAGKLVEWVSSIPLETWPQQTKATIKPAMVTDLDWHGFGRKSHDVVREVMDRHFPGCSSFQRMLSVVMPGHNIEPHRDHQASYWICRVHVPLTTNDHSDFIVDGEHFQMETGTAYMVNTTAEHSVVNDGATPRIHFMWDVRTTGA